MDQVRTETNIQGNQLAKNLKTLTRRVFRAMKQKNFA